MPQGETWVIYHAEPGTPSTTAGGATLTGRTTARD